MVFLKSHSSKTSSLKSSYILFPILILLCFRSQASAAEILSEPQQKLQSIEASLPDSLFKAVMAGDADVVNKLISEGVDFNSVDERGWTPLDYAVKRNRIAIREILLEHGARTYPKPIPDMKEGPHVRAIDSLRFEVLMLENDAESANSDIARDTLSIRDLPDNMKGLLIEPEDIDFDATLNRQRSSWSDAAKIFVIGDIHGEYDRVFSLLKNNSIIDEEGNWNWGKGHLVFMGDVFDRGSKVTETFWMIFRLEKQAKKKGGMVHLLLGNHEPMIFNDDIRYITDDYYALCDNLGLNYPGLFDESSVLGHWLRQKPVVLRINQFTLMHAGISPELYNLELEADTINMIVREYLNNAESLRNAETRKMILGNNGILWYRGMAATDSRNNLIDENALNRELDFYKSQVFIIGHTEVDSVTLFYGGKVIDVNIPKRERDIEEQGLLIKGKRIWVVYDIRKRKEIYSGRTE